MLPLLTVVTGRPGSGKTTLAQRLAQTICCPLLSRDQIKEGFCVTQDADHVQLPGNTNQRLYEVFFDLVDAFLARRISLVIEAAFQHRLWQPRLTPLIGTCDLRLIRCVVDPAVARRRAIDRGLANPRRERFHRDFAVQAARQGEDLPIGDFTAVDLPVPTLDVDTDGDYRPDFGAIVAFAMSGRSTIG